MSQSLSQMVVSALREVSTPAPIVVHPTFVHGDGRYITPTTVVVMPNMDTSMLCGLTYDERKQVININKRGGGRWLRNGSFQVFKNDMQGGYNGS